MCGRDEKIREANEAELRPGMLVGTGTGEPYTSKQPNIADRCPSCGARSLFIGSGGWLTCSVIGCANPAVSDAIETLRTKRDEHLDRIADERDMVIGGLARLADLVGAPRTSPIGPGQLIECLEAELRRILAEHADRGRLLTRSSQSDFDGWRADAYQAQLECMERSWWFRLGRRWLGFGPVRPIDPYAGKPDHA